MLVTLLTYFPLKRLMLNRPTYLPTYLPTYQPTNSPTYLLPNLPINRLRTSLPQCFNRCDSYLYCSLSSDVKFIVCSYSDSCSGGQFLERMRDYMPPKHRAFIEAVSHGPSIRKFGEYCSVGT